jgi:glycosyltransferase involved in cell wall biosynthesis
LLLADGVIKSLMRLFLNSLAASSGGALTYLKNVIPHLSSKTGLRTTIAVQPFLRQEFEALPRISVIEIPTPASVTRRFWHEQTVLPRLIRESGADVLLSTGNIALRKSPVPQILLSRNSLYTSTDFFRDLRQRRDYRLWIDTKMRGAIAKRSISWADCTVAPTQAFAEELRAWTGQDIVSIHHGFDGNFFRCSSESLSDDIQDKLESNRNALRLLFVSHYNYYRNFEMLFSALPLLRQQLPGKKTVLFLTCKLESNGNAGQYQGDEASSLVRRLGIADQVVELGAVPYRFLHHLYRACHVYVTPAYAETFAHPLVEAMASGIPVVASDIPVHREICHDAALYFDRFSPDKLASQVRRVLLSPELQRKMSESGINRSSEFSWEKHVGALLELTGRVLGQSTVADVMSPTKYE